MRRPGNTGIKVPANPTTTINAKNIKDIDNYKSFTILAYSNKK